MEESRMLEIARVCHEVNRGYCEFLGDTSQVPWEEAQDWQKQSSLNRVSFHVSDPNAGPDACHEDWLAEKVADGWVYGPVKDADKKTHPCMVSYADLPAEQRAKDHIFRAIVLAMSSAK